MSYEEMRQNLSHVPPSLLHDLLQQQLQAKQNSSNPFGAMGSILGAGPLASHQLPKPAPVHASSPSFPNLHTKKNNTVELRRKVQWHLTDQFSMNHIRLSMALSGCRDSYLNHTANWITYDS